MSKERIPRIQYFDIVNYHKQITGYNIPLNVREIIDMMGSEYLSVDKIEDIDLYEAKLPKEYITYIPLIKFLDVHNNARLKTEKSYYKWLVLEKSIDKEGIKFPILVALDPQGTSDKYFVIEGKHRFAALTMTRQVNAHYLVPCLLLKENIEYTDYMFGAQHHSIKYRGKNISGPQIGFKNLCSDQ